MSLAATSCTATGDFGRPQRLMLFGADPAAPWPSDGPLPAIGSSLGLTADEREMRETAYRLRVQVDTTLPVASAADAGDGYSNRLMHAQFQYGPSRLARIEYDIASDHDALTRFGQAARRVAFADRERRRGLADHRGRFAPRDRGNAGSRIRENRAFMMGTMIDLDRRLAAYRHAIDRTRIETPAVATSAVDSTLHHLKDRAASLRYELTQIYAAGGTRAQPYKPIEAGAAPYGK